MADEFLLTGISLRAAALTYSIILSMIPMLAMSTAVLKGLGSDNQLRTAAYRLLDELEPAAPAGQGSTPHDTTGASPPLLQPAAPGESPLSLTGHLRSAVDTIFDYVDRT
ncbi:MAG TPA: YihY/virulence factor BrkB family protein, partial [Desulfobulbus sp.]|nr:YihY/virulence factor BrkB family protein [Desulfobulbus sp.]